MTLPGLSLGVDWGSWLRAARKDGTRLAVVGSAQEVVAQVDSYASPPGRRRWSGHKKVEEFSIRMHIVIAERLQANPEAVIGLAKSNIARWRKMDPDSKSDPYFVRWERLLNGPLPDLLEFMVSPSQEARDMRQCSPFPGVLTDRERWDILRAVSAEREVG